MQSVNSERMQDVCVLKHLYVIDHQIFKFQVLQISVYSDLQEFSFEGIYYEHSNSECI